MTESRDKWRAKSLAPKKENDQLQKQIKDFIEDLDDIKMNLTKIQ
jgi:hypothetical protein